MISVIVTLFVTYVVLCLLLFVFQRRMIYFPTPELSVPGVAHVVLDTGDVRIKVWIINPGMQKALIYFGGNAENVAYNIDDFRVLFADRTVYLVNYRGYGGSSGSPHEEGISRDALFIYDHFTKNHRSISVMGRSVGSAFATYLASKRDIEKLVLLTPFDSASNVGKKLYRVFPIDLILRERLDSAGRAADISAETLIVAVTDDEVIHNQHTRNLFEAFTGSRVQFTSLSDTGHNSVQMHPDYGKTIAEFMR